MLTAITLKGKGKKKNIFKHLHKLINKHWSDCAWEEEHNMYKNHVFKIKV